MKKIFVKPDEFYISQTVGVLLIIILLFCANFASFSYDLAPVGGAFRETNLSFYQCIKGVDNYLIFNFDRIFNYTTLLFIIFAFIMAVAPYFIRNRARLIFCIVGYSSMMILFLVSSITFFAQMGSKMYIGETAIERKVIFQYGFYALLFLIILNLSYSIFNLIKSKKAV